MLDERLPPDHLRLALLLHLGGVVGPHLLRGSGLRQWSKGSQGGSKEGGLSIGRREGLSMYGIESKARSNQLLLTTPIPWDPLSSLQTLGGLSPRLRGDPDTGRLGLGTPHLCGTEPRGYGRFPV